MTTPIARPPWLCSPNLIMCQNDHILWFNKAGFRKNDRGLMGHSFCECKDCATYFLAVYYSVPSPMVYCYALSKESYDYWNEMTGDTPSTGELLHLARDPNGRSHWPNWKAR